MSGERFKKSRSDFGPFGATTHRTFSAGHYAVTVFLKVTITDPISTERLLNVLGVHITDCRSDYLFNKGLTYSKTIIQHVHFPRPKCDSQFVCSPKNGNQSWTVLLTARIIFFASLGRDRTSTHSSVLSIQGKGIGSSPSPPFVFLRYFSSI